ncbi:hypothetical protein ABTZ99_42130 [Actinosynnema sp. NPDC002837]
MNYHGGGYARAAEVVAHRRPGPAGGARLAGNRAHGVNATIEARFSAGVPWPIGIISHDLPIQAAHFQPDYGADGIILKPEFFAEVDDGPVTLTFHFWSGATTAYRITKTGDVVTGNPG